MTREEILNGMSEEEFYDMYPTQEAWENAQQMKLGGLSGAPHDGQPTADQFFSYGSHANDGINIPMSNPFYAANGGTPYYGGPIRPYQDGGYMDDGGNMASPTNYGAFNVPMQAGGILDPGNNQDYPILEEGGKANLMAMIKAHSKKMKKAYESGGDTVTQGGNSDDYPTNLTNTFKNVLKKNMYNHMVNEEEQAFSKEFMQMGGYQGQGMNYNTTTFNDVDPQNEAIQDMYKQRIAHYDTDLKNSFGNLSNSMYNLKHTARPYTQTSVSYAADGAQTGTPRTMSQEEWDWLDQQRKAKEREANYNKYFGQGTRGMNYLPINYNPYNKISRKDVAMLQELAKNPTTNLKEFKHSHFGPWGRTKMTFGYKDQSPFTENKQDPIQVDLKNNPNDFDFQKEAGFDQPGPRAWNQYKEEDPMQGFIPKRIMLDSIFNTENFPNNTSNQQNVDPEIEEFNKNNSSNNNDLKPVMPDYNNRNTEPYNSSLLQNMLKINPYSRVKYGGLTKAQYGLDHKSTNPADGTYDNFGNPIGLSSATGNMGLSSNPISMGTSFQPVGNAPGAPPSAISYQGTNAPAFSTPESVGIQQQNTEMKGMRNNSEKQATITSKQRPGFNGMAAADSIIAGIDTATSLINKARDTSKQKLSTLQLADNAFLANTSNAQSQGDYDPNSGMFRPNKMVPVQFPGYNAAYGGAMYQEGGNNSMKLSNAEIVSFLRNDMAAGEHRRGIINPTPSIQEMSAKYGNLTESDKDRVMKLMQSQAGQNLYLDDTYMRNHNFHPFNPFNIPAENRQRKEKDRIYQEGGMQEEMQAQPEQSQQEQIMQGVASMLQQGAQPEQVAQQLVKMGIPQDQVMQIIQAVMQQLQGGQEEQQMQPAMRYGGYAMGGSSDDEESYEDDLDEDEIAELKRQGYNIEYLD